jgi:hypothetical protein
MTYTYAVLDVAPETYDDLTQRLLAAGALGRYLHINLTAGRSGEERLLVFGDIAFRKEQDDASS